MQQATLLSAMPYHISQKKKTKKKIKEIIFEICLYILMYNRHVPVTPVWNSHFTKNYSTKLWGKLKHTEIGKV